MSGDIDAFLECLEPLGPVRPRRMFGAIGLFLDGRCFALEIDGVLYLKADEVTVDRFKAAGCEPFTYRRKGGRPIAMSYWTLPDACLDDPDETLDWARLAVAAAFRAKG